MWTLYCLLRGGEEPQICINLDCYFSYWLVTVEKFYAWGTAFQFSVWTCHAESKSGKNGENKNMKYRKYKKNIVVPLRTCISHSALWRWGNFWNWFFSLWTKEKQASSWWNCGAGSSIVTNFENEQSIKVANIIYNFFNNV